MKKQLPPLIESWVRQLHDQNTSVWVRENHARELQNILDEVSAALRKFELERNMTIDTELGKKKRRR